MSSPRLKLLSQSLGNIAAVLVEHSRRVGTRFVKQSFGPVSDFLSGPLRFNHQQYDIHETRQPWRDARLRDRRHIKNDVVVVTGLHLGNQMSKAFWQYARKLLVVRFKGRNEIKRSEERRVGKECRERGE